MTRTKNRSRLIVLLVLGLAALTVFAAACGDGQETTTTVAGATTTVSAGPTTQETTIVQGGKSLDEYRAQVPELEKALEADPQDVASLEALAVAHYQLGEYDGAIEAYKKILAITDDAFIHNALGNAYREQQKWDLAIAEYETSISLDPTLKHPYINLAGVYNKRGDVTKALEVLERAKTALNVDDAKVAENYQNELTSTTTTLKK